MSGSELSSIYRLEFYKKQYQWALKPTHRISQRYSSEVIEDDLSASATSTSLHRHWSCASSAQSQSSSQLNTTYSVEEGGGDGDAPETEPLPKPRFVDDFVDSWVHAASSCSSRDAEADGLCPLEPESEFCAGAAGAPHSSEINLYHPDMPEAANVTQANSFVSNAGERDKGYVSAIPPECDVRRPPPPLPPPQLSPTSQASPAPTHRPADMSECCNDICDATRNMCREWSVDELVAAAGAELRAAAAHANRHRALVALCHRYAPRHLPSFASAPSRCLLCGTPGAMQAAPAPPAPPPAPTRGRGHLVRMAPAVPLDVGRWAQVQAAAMAARYP